MRSQNKLKVVRVNLKDISANQIKGNLATVVPVNRDEPGAYFVHKVKCLNCSLHFAVYSWRKTLPIRNYCCPECQHPFYSGKYVWWRERHVGQIYQQLPGNAEDVETVP